MTDHPNAAVGTVSGAGGGALVIWVLSLLGLEISDPYVAATLAGVLSGFALLIGKKGIKGLARMIWRGSEK